MIIMLRHNITLTYIILFGNTLNSMLIHMDVNRVLKCIGLEPKKFKEQKYWEICLLPTIYLHTIVSMMLIQFKTITN